MRKAWQGGRLFIPIFYLIPSFHRFSTQPYTTDPEHIGNNFVHLTNYSINKDSDNFEQNSDPDSPWVGFETILLLGRQEVLEVLQGSKWTLTSLWKYLWENCAIEKKPIWDKGQSPSIIKDLPCKVIKMGQTIGSLSKTWRTVYCFNATIRTMRLCEFYKVVFDFKRYSQT